MMPADQSEERTYAAVFHSILGDVEDLVRSELKLAKAEVRDEVSALARGVAWLAMGIITGFVAVSFLSVALFFGLSGMVSHWLAALLTGLLLAVLSGASLALRRSAKTVAMTQQASSNFQPKAAGYE